MAYICEICGKGRMAGRHVSHAKNRVVRSTVPNLHKISLGRGQDQMRLCTDCLRKIKSIKTAVKAAAAG